MNNVKKILIIILGVLVIATISFFSGRYSYSKRFKDMEGRITESTRVAREYEDKLKIINRSVEKLTIKNRQFTAGLNTASKENRQLTDRLNTTSEGLSESIEGLSGVIKGIDYYIGRAEDSEKD